MLMHIIHTHRPTINICFSIILTTVDKICGQVTLLNPSKQAQGTNALAFSPIL